ncbi:MAG: SoxR reducing system RseC family protein [Paraglaciecola sp.]|uniref:SoxR reducing system RseC family protein n=1 Tax=Paraglaciecola sp. TaxID=1920173 RepID=UPI00273F5AD0|nr:SoxR reducing system RseC family protein [Paraglaciecola sp.]MDP5028932.1 SoxR reducing system RseC family protein [Paraglaciecola sp.]MDP5041538.1 SoxR reducing system RseC family protein [Paraglaciecola sp.]MDP5132600.1 SoxR reducing system RseC family protein [Paraglaciecola sp.]
MIEEVGTIVSVTQEHGVQNIWVETAIKTTCSSCQAQTNCGTSVVAKAFSPKKQSIKLPYEHAVVIGQKVKLGVPEEALLSASLQVYLLPLLGLILGSSLASYVMPFLALESELWVVLTGFIMAGVVFLLIRNKLAEANNLQYCPTLIEVYPNPVETISVKNL